MVECDLEWIMKIDLNDSDHCLMKDQRLISLQDIYLLFWTEAKSKNLGITLIKTNILLGRFQSFPLLERKWQRKGIKGT